MAEPEHKKHKTNPEDEPTQQIKLYGKLPIKFAQSQGKLKIIVASVNGEVKEIPHAVPYKISLIDNKYIINDPVNSRAEWFYWDSSFETCKNYITYENRESMWKPFSRENSEIVERAFQKWDRTPKTLCKIYNGKDLIEINYLHNGYLCQKGYKIKPIGRVTYRWAWDKKETGNFENYNNMSALEHSYRSSKVFEEVCTDSRTEYKVNLTQKYQVSLGGDYYRREVKRESTTEISILGVRRLNFDGYMIDLNEIAPRGIAWTSYDRTSDLNIEQPVQPDDPIKMYIVDNYAPNGEIKVYGYLPLFKSYIHSIFQTLKEVTERNIEIPPVSDPLLDPPLVLNKFANECYMWCPYSNEETRNDILTGGPVYRFCGDDDRKCVCARLYFKFEDAVAASHIGVFLCRVNLGFTSKYTNYYNIMYFCG